MFWWCHCVSSKWLCVFWQSCVDDIICIKLNGKQFSLNSDFYVCLCCVVPENSSRHTLIETHTFDRLLEFITNLDANDTNELNFVLCGDLNAHISDLPDYVAFDTFLEKVLPEDYINDIISTGFSQDKDRTNNNGWWCWIFVSRLVDVL